MKIYNKLSNLSKSSFIKSYTQQIIPKYNHFSFNRIPKFNFSVMSNSNPEVKVISNLNF